MKDAPADERINERILQLQVTAMRIREAAEWRKRANEEKNRIETARYRSQDKTGAEDPAPSASPLILKAGNLRPFLPTGYAFSHWRFAPC